MSGVGSREPEERELSPEAGKNAAGREADYYLRREMREKYVPGRRLFSIPLRGRRAPR